MSDFPLIVDLDNALLRTDLLLECLFAGVKRGPSHTWRLIASSLIGRWDGLDMLEHLRLIEVSQLPYDKRVIDLIQKERERGRAVILVSHRYRQYAHRIAEHLQIFDQVIVADDGADTGKGVDDAVQKATPLGREYLRRNDARRNRRSLSSWPQALRLHQWAKNLLLFVPLLASHRLREPYLVSDSALAFLLFGLCSSSVYLLNDLLDLNDDRHHPKKRLRALASGDIGIASALCLIPALFIGSFLGAACLLPIRFVLALAAYYGITLVYSLALKRVMMLDVVLLAILYTLRIIAGVFVIRGQLTFWMLAFSMFIFMSLALAKRYTELHDAKLAGYPDKVRGRGYITGDLPMVASMGTASGFLAVMVLALYIQDHNTAALYRHPRLIWFACPLLLFWVGRTWMLTHRGEMHDDPVLFAITDRASLLTAALFGLIFALAA